MQEVEVKILNVNRPKVEEELLRLGGRKVFDGNIETFFFDFKNGSIAKAKGVLRLRQEGSQIVLTFKRIISTQGAKVAEEHSVEVSDIDEMKKIFQLLGLSVKESNQKQRISYQIDNVHFDFDRYEGEYNYLPEFMEIEAEDLETIHKYAKLLGFKPEDCLPWSTSDLIKHYADKNRFEKS